MIKLQDFARECGVTDRAIQKHLKKHEQELAGHFQRMGPNGTWIDDDAQEFIRNLMVKKSVAVTDRQTLRELEQLKAKIVLLEERIERKDILIENLQQTRDEKQKLLDAAERKLLESEEQAQKKIEEAVKTAEDKLKLEIEVQQREAENKLKNHFQEEIQRLSTALKAERERKWKFPWSK